jgi:hypothetical protein
MDSHVYSMNEAMFEMQSQIAQNLGNVNANVGKRQKFDLIQPPSPTKVTSNFNSCRKSAAEALP